MNWLPKNTGTLGRIFFGLALIGFGLLQLLRQDFVRLVPKLPVWIPWPQLWAVAGGAALLVAGLAIAADWRRRPAAIGLGILFLAVMLLYIPGVSANPRALFMWGNPCKTLALLSGAWLIAVMLPRVNGPERRRALDRARLICAVCFGGFLVVCGIMHFVYVDFVVPMVPPWMPGRSFWACFTGVALMAGGIGVNFRPTGRLAAALSGLMIFLWVVMLHIPRAVAGWPETGETAAIFEALALSGTALLLASASPRQKAT